MLKIPYNGNILKAHSHDYCLCATRVTRSAIENRKLSHVIYFVIDFEFRQTMGEPMCHGDPRLVVFYFGPIIPLPLSGWKEQVQA